MQYANYLEHSGTPHVGMTPHSGRYKYGSGGDPKHDSTYQSFLERDRSLRKKGLTLSERAQYQGMTVNELRRNLSTARAYEDAARTRRCVTLKQTGMSTMAIARETGIAESTVRLILNRHQNGERNKASAVADVLKDRLKAQGGYLDVTGGSEIELNCSASMLKTACRRLTETGDYNLHRIQIDQATGMNKTTVMVLTDKDKDMKNVYDNRDKIISPYGQWIDDDGLTTRNLRPPKSISSDRVLVKYDETGGTERDGTIDIRPGVPDISLDGRPFAQVRIAVDNTHYLKGMAVYRDDIPDGYDVVFNSNKHQDKGKMAAMKELKKVKDADGNETSKIDWENPFGSTIKTGGQWDYIDPKTGKKKQSIINIVNEEDDWEKWKKSIPSQVLSKQTPALARRQLGISAEEKAAEFEKIKSLKNGTLKKSELIEFAEKCDTAAESLAAAALPRQATHVILPINSLKENEIFAPNYKDGEEVICWRYPHEGVYQIPRLIVNNKNKEALKVIGNDAAAAVGINSKTAEQLSGADFDGDTIVVAPTKGIKSMIKTRPYLEELKGFDSKSYKNPDNVPKTGPETGFIKQKEMGIATNLIMDMTLKGGYTDTELARATKYSMVVIDAEKHNLDWKGAQAELGIQALKQKYQKKPDGGYGGASTLVTKSTSEEHVDFRKQWRAQKTGSIDPVTGEKIYQIETDPYKKQYSKKVEKSRYATDPVTGEKLRDPKTGKLIREKYDDYVTVERTTKTTKMREAKDARELSSGTLMEEIYADYANTMKKMANQARLEWLRTEDIKRDPQAAKVYAKEVESLNAKINLALAESPKERKANIMVSSQVKALRAQNPDIDKDELKKIKQQMINVARLRAGKPARRHEFEVTEDEWEAIENHAVSASTLNKIIQYTDSGTLKNYSMPREKKKVSDNSIRWAKTLLSRGYTIADVAEQLNISPSTLNNEIKKKGSLV